MTTLLLGAQGGDEECFACLYALTNPVLVRYLRVVSDADPAALARSTWPTLLDRMAVCVADDDDDWLELAVSTARQSALASAAVGADATPALGSVGAARTATSPGSDAADDPAVDPVDDPVDAAVAVLRTCEPAVAEVLAMGLTAGLGKDSIARITGHEPTDVLALVRAGEDRLAMPLESLVAAMQARGSSAEVDDLPAILPLFAAQSQSPLSAVADPAPELATAASAGTATVVNLLTWHSPTQAAAVVPAGGAIAAMSPRWARVGVGAAVWTLGVGGVAAAAAMIGVIPAAIHGLFGDGGNGAVVASHGPIRPGGVPSPSAGGPGTTPLTTPPPSTGQSGQSGQSGQPGQQGSQGQVGLATPVSASPSGDGVVVSAATIGFGTSTQLVVAPAVLTVSPSGSPVTTPSALGGSSPTSIPKPPSPGTVTPSGVVAGTGTAHASGKRHLKHTTGLAKGRSKTAQPAAKTLAAARAHAQKAAAAKAKAKAAKAKAAGKAATAQVRTARSRA
ncbi:hypothetical protein [Nostocoides sp. HKS02]|uniref:hypothetical protein n=1 Tax=Nostocoides sp. HKS02 TaxID=1813880 RepID=UPI0012B4CB5F|nr:hypothetical protein [Tetrasphaera sp. HKS02]QGN57640.1 hypothetical protein GKE56_06865 [Tetrasphaera sp. HKS02]